MGNCIGFGKFKGVCPNCTSLNGSPVFCSRCADLKAEEKEKKKKLSEQEQSEKRFKKSEERGN